MAKHHAAEYLGFLAGEWGGLPGLADVASIFGEITGIYRGMMETLAQDPWSPAHLGDPVGPEQASELARLAGEAKALETKAVGMVKTALAR